jgi:SAM-dependent methyltransferase
MTEGLPDQSAMSSYSGYEDWKRWEKESFGKCDVVTAVYFSAELARAGIKSCQGHRFFELGFGNGAFAGYVRDRGGEYVGAEVNAGLIERALSCGINVLEGGVKQALQEIGPASFDVFVTFDVLEHLDVAAIKSLVSDVKMMLKPGGIFLARVPSGDSPFGRAIFHGDLTHLTALGSSAVKQLASQSGFDVIEIASPKLPLSGVGFRRGLRRAAIVIAQKIIGLLINLIYHEGQPRVITPNLVFVLSKKS